MNIVIPMAGRGSRLMGSEHVVPKPFIEVAGRPLWWWAVSGLPVADGDRLVFVALNEHLEAFGFAEAAHAEYPRCDTRVVGLDNVTPGQLCTVLSSIGELDIDEPLIVFNADSYIRQRNDHLLELIERFDGVIGVARRSGDSWSFVRTDPAGAVLEVAEKIRISDRVCTGLYCFRSARLFQQMAEIHVADSREEGAEYFVAPLYNDFLEAQMRLAVLETDSFLPIGTPSEIDEFRAAVRGGIVNTRSLS